MNSTPEKDEPFVVGLTMAGAVSAGAYTAGVLDYLFRAIDRHNASVAEPEAPDHDPRPRHRVVVKVMSGASAGGVCAGLALAGLIDRQQPGTRRLRPPEEKSFAGEAGAVAYDVTLPPLHRVWVEDIDLFSDQSTGLLGRQDLDNEKRVTALLNGAHLDDAANAALRNVTWGESGAAGVHPGQPYDFLASGLDLFLTTTNLMGVPYAVSFQGDTPAEGLGHRHRMAQHSTVRHFRVDALGAREVTSHWLESWHDAGIGLALPDQPGGIVPFVEATGEDGANAAAWQALKTSALATGAFPAGLPSRLVAARAEDFGQIGDADSATGGAMPIDVDPGKVALARPDLDKLVSTDPVNYVAVDGGVANNEPFEYARFTIRKFDRRKKELVRNPRGAVEADRAVIMIDPFPEGPVFEDLTAEQASETLGLVRSVMGLLPALINQARFKPGELINAADRDIHSRFLIRPSRPRHLREFSDADAGAMAADQMLYGQAAIASGAFGGFSGFFDHSFRVHDFLLGQENCKRFLEDEFRLAVKNEILRLPEAHPRRQGHEKCPIIFLDAPGGADEGPALAHRPVTVPAWPRLGPGRLSRLLRQAQERLKLVAQRLIMVGAPDWYILIGARLLWDVPWLNFGLKPIAATAMKKIVLSGFVERRQLSGYDIFDDARFDDLRRILVTIIKSGGRPRTFSELYDETFPPDRKTAPPPRMTRTELRDHVDEELVGRGLIWRSHKLLGEHRYRHPDFPINLVTRLKSHLF